MELIGKAVLLGIVEGSVASPVVTALGTFHRSPLRLVLRRHLIPEFVVFRHTTSCIHLIAGGNITQELVGVGR